MDIALTPLAPRSEAPAATPPAPQSEELTQFLSLLTAQVQNQDPLEPLDATAFTEQLATFSALEQQVQSNRLLEDILAALSGDGA